MITAFVLAPETRVSLMSYPVLFKPTFEWKFWPQSSQTKQRSLWVYICLSRAVWVAIFLSHRSQSTTPWSTRWWLLSSLIEPKDSMQILHCMVRACLSWFPRTDFGFAVVSTGHEALLDTSVISTFSLVLLITLLMGKQSFRRRTTLWGLRVFGFFGHWFIVVHRVTRHICTIILMFCWPKTVPSNTDYHWF